MDQTKAAPTHLPHAKTVPDHGQRRRPVAVPHMRHRVGSPRQPVHRQALCAPQDTPATATDRPSVNLLSSTAAGRIRARVGISASAAHNGDTATGSPEEEAEEEVRLFAFLRTLRILFRTRYATGGHLPGLRPDRSGEILIRMSPGRGYCIEPGCDWEYVGGTELEYAQAHQRHLKLEHGIRG